MTVLADFQETATENSSQSQFTEEDIEVAFRRMDVNNDGFVDWEEFRLKANAINVEQAERVFKSIDQVAKLDKVMFDFYFSMTSYFFQNGDKKLSLEEFHQLLAAGKSSQN